MTLQTLLAHPVVRGAITGSLAAAAVDFQAFRSWKSFDDVTKYDWRLAAFRWVQGAIVGGLAGLGFGA